MTVIINHYYYAPDLREVGNKHCPILHATHTPVSKSNSQRSGLQTSRGIPCRPNLAATLLVKFHLAKLVIIAAFVMHLSQSANTIATK